MANTKEYKIVINGLQESIDAVKSLNEQLKGLEDRIKVLQDKAINIKTNVSSVGATTSSASKSASSSVISTENEIIKQQNEELRLQAKINAARDESFKALDATKAQYKEIIADQKQVAAQERINADAYSHTMQGMKQQLADLKAVINTTVIDEPDGLEKISEYTKKANELTDKLKKMEEAYGQFGRNVGNYQSALDGLDKYKITIGGVTREFDNAKQAAKILSNELLNLPKGAKGADELHEALLKIRSDIADLQKSSSVMDNLLDTMESFTAIANVGQGIRALFGVDDAEMQKSIQNLVALQNILKGIETINKQMKTGEGIGGWIKPFTTQIDGAIAKLDTLQTTMKATTVTSKAMVVGLKAATYALKAFKAALSLGISIAIDLVIEGALELIETLKEGDKEFERANKVQEEGAKAYAEAAAKISGYMARLKSFNGTKAEEKKLVDEINKDMGTSIGQYKTVDELQKALTLKGQAYAKVMMLQAKAQALLNAYTENYVKLLAAQKNAAAGGDKWKEWLPWNWGGKSAQEKADEEVTQIKADGDKILNEYNGVMQEIDKVSKDFKLFGFSDQIEKNGNKTKDAVKKVEDELIKLRIRNMKEGLNKVITQLEEERKAELRKIKGNSREAGEKRLEINKYYNNKIREEMKKSAENVENLYKSLEKSLHSYQLKNFNSFIDIINKQVGIQKNELQKVYSNILNQGISSYGIQGKSQLSPGTRTQLGIVSEDNGEFMEDMKELVEKYRLLQAYENAYNSLLMKRQVLYNDLSDDEKEFLDEEIKGTKLSLDEREKLYEEYNAKLIDIYGSENVGDAFSTLIQENYTERLSTIFHQRYTVYESYWDNIISFVKEASKKEKDYALSAETEEYDERKDNALKYYNEQLKISNDYYDSKKELIEAEYNKGLISESEYYVELENLEKDYEDKQKQLEANYEVEKINLQKQHEQNEKTIEQNRLKKLQDINKEYYEFRLQELRDFQTAIANLENKQPVMNAWGITNFPKTNENNRNLLDSYQTLAAQIVSIKEELQRKLENNEISFDDFQNANRELDSFADNVGQKMDKVKYKLSMAGQIEQFIQDIQMYFQAATQGLQDILNAVWNYQDYLFEKQQDELDKWNEELDKKLDEQQEIVEKHKDAIDSIENELATARGSRRQHLIDQLNAEMQAQREARRQEQKIQKEKEKAEKKQEDLDKQRREEEYERNVKQAFISWHLSIANGLATQPFMPVGIAMGALATALGAVQYALVKSQKPYAKGGQLDGGVAQGKRHRDGGIPVLGGRASIEGGEFITNRITTQNNVDVLDFINSRHKKLSLDDFINFYSSGKLKKNISSMSPRTAFADGGVIPTISNDIDINDRLLSAMEAYAERPVVVSVVDINNRQNAVKNVQVLAGLE